MSYYDQSETDAPFIIKCENDFLIFISPKAFAMMSLHFLVQSEILLLTAKYKPMISSLPT